MNFTNQTELRVLRFLIVLFVLAGTSCDQDRDVVATSTDSHSSQGDATQSSGLTNEQLSFPKRERQQVERLLERNGVSVLHEPPTKKLTSSIIKLSSGACFDATKLQEPWYFSYYAFSLSVNVYDDGFALAVKSDELGIPYYKVTVPKDVDYEFVTPGQEYLTLFVRAASEKDKIRYKRRVQKQLYKPREEKPSDSPHINVDVLPYTKLKLTQASGWNFEFFQSVSCRHCDDGPYIGSPHYIVDHDRNAFVKLRLSDDHWMQQEWVSRLRPTAGFFNAGRLQGSYLHSSELFTVEFTSSSRATVQTPKIFKSIDDVVTNLMSDCDE